MIRYLMLSALSVGAVLLAALAKAGPGEIVPWQGIFQRVAGSRWVDRAAQVQAESGFNASAQSWIVNKQGARVPCAYGPAQFTPPTWKIWGRPPTADPHDPNYAIPAQNNYMNWLEPRAGGNDQGLAGYNWGLGNVLKVQRRVSALGEPGANAWVKYCPAETQGYLVHNHTNQARIRALGGKP